MINLYLDDVRPAPPGFTRCYTTYEVIAYLKAKPGEIDLISLDNDLGPFPEGREVIRWLAEQTIAGNRHYWPKRVRIHTGNIVAKEWMYDMCKAYAPEGVDFHTA